MGLLRSRAAWWALALTAAVCTLSSSTRARAAPITTRLDWVTTVCPSGDFSSRVLSRTRAVRFVASGARFTVRLSIEPRGSALEARVRIQGPGGPDTVRQIASQNCDDALDALALVVAISLEARASAVRSARPSGRPTLPPPERSPEAPAPEAPAPAPEPAPAPAPTTETTPEAPPLPRTVEPPSPRIPDLATDESRRLAAPSVSAPERPRRWALGAGVSALLSIGVAPATMIGAEIWLRWSWERGQLVSPEVNLSFAHQRLDGYRRPDGEADFALNIGNIALCPLRLGSSASLRPCATLSAGRFSSAGRRTFSAAARDRPWLTFGAQLQGLVPIGPLELRAAAGAAMPVVRDAFRFGPPCSDEACDGTFDRVDALIWSGAAGLGVSF